MTAGEFVGLLCHLAALSGEDDSLATHCTHVPRQLHIRQGLTRGGIL